MNGDWASAYWRDRRGSDLVHNGRQHIRHRRAPCAEVAEIRRHMKQVKSELRIAVIRLHRVSTA